MRTRKRFGQHFLQHRAILDRIVAALAPAPGDLVLEIGPGPGALTEALAARDARVVAIEKDRDLVPLAQRRVPGARIVEGDALTLDWREVAECAARAAAAVPEHPLQHHLAALDRALLPPRPTRIVFLVQKEVAERSPRGRGEDLWALTVGVQAVARSNGSHRAGRRVHPASKVESACAHRSAAEPLVKDAEWPCSGGWWGLFGFRRKQLCWGSGADRLAVERVTAALERAGLVASARPETIDRQGFAACSRFH